MCAIYTGVVGFGTTPAETMRGGRALDPDVLIVRQIKYRQAEVARKGLVKAALLLSSLFSSKELRE